jgi:hypothetical protein
VALEVDIVSVGEEGTRILIFDSCDRFLCRGGELGRCGDLEPDVLVSSRRDDVVGGGFDVELECKGFAASALGDLAGFLAGMGGDRVEGFTMLRLCTIQCI